MEYLLAAIFLPLFPLSILFNVLFARTGSNWLRILLITVWPVTGVYIIVLLGENPPQWIVVWAALTALLYAFRSLVMRELNRWTAYMATSSWALLWLVFLPQSESSAQWLIATALVTPLIFMVWLTGRFEKRFGGVYTGLINGLAINTPRMATLLVFVVLAVIATPLFPGFFALLGMVNKLLPVIPLVAIGVLMVWFLWTWSGIRILQGLMVGPASEDCFTDIGFSALVSVMLILIAYVVAGLTLSGGLL